MSACLHVQESSTVKSVSTSNVSALFHAQVRGFIFDVSSDREVFGKGAFFTSVCPLCLSEMVLPLARSLPQLWPPSWVSSRCLFHQLIGFNLGSFMINRKAREMEKNDTGG